ncbi:hypothetical protein GGP41_003253 [Bipolaris sorokiniana]|uniref:Uncharacterized protein n=1 Tax=Cochliobolus sativus TaxID=45130 RepID=A0A8H5ZB03_COCSA|nr:hypothetical protein GGP41_003253 [Bipolaris sorokiniana]
MAQATVRIHLVWWRDGFPTLLLARQPSRALRDATKLVGDKACAPPAEAPGAPPKRSLLPCGR